MAEKILIIEDDFFIRELYERQFVKEGYEIVTAEDGPDGLLKASQVKPDLILLDIMLPKLNGLDLLKTLKGQEETQNIPVILLTNLGQESVIKEGFENGAESYLIKSAYTPSQIIQEVKNFLAQREG